MADNILSLNSVTESPLLIIGAIADVQYADVENGSNFLKTKQRYYRNSNTLLKEAIADWSKYSCETMSILQLGDLIDGRCRKSSMGSEISLERTLDEFDRIQCPVYHVVGNHELYNFTREKLFGNKRMFPSLVQTDAQPNFYYSVILHPKLKLVVLDCYEIGVLGHHEESETYNTAMATIRKHNSNTDVNDPNGLMGHYRRFLGFNGALSSKQLQWFETELSESAYQEQNVIVAGHLTIFEDSDDMCLCWNYKEVHDVILRNFACVVCYLSGHNHSGGEAVDSKNIQHVTFPGIIETPPETNSFGTMFLHKCVLEIKGTGRLPNYSIPLRYSI